MFVHIQIKMPLPSNILLSTTTNIENQVHELIDIYNPSSLHAPWLKTSINLVDFVEGVFKSSDSML